MTGFDFDLTLCRGSIPIGTAWPNDPGFPEASKNGDFLAAFGELDQEGIEG